MAAGAGFAGAALALLLEFRYSKPRILEAYLNTIYLGQDGDVPETRVDRVREGNVDEPVLPSERYGRLGAIAG